MYIYVYICAYRYKHVHMYYINKHTHICIYMYIYKMYTMHLIIFLKSTTIYEEYYMGGDISMSFLFSMPSCAI